MNNPAITNTSFSSLLFKKVIPIAISGLTVVILLTTILLNDMNLYLIWSEGEGSLVEIGTVVLACFGVYLSIVNFRNRGSVPFGLFGPLMLFFVLGFLYIALEEASWGQHLFGWHTPEWLQGINRQQETNIHNLYGKQIDRLPKAILGALIVLGGVIWPLFVTYKKTPLQLPNWFSVLAPTNSTFIAALSFFVIWLIGRSMVIFDLDIHHGQKINFSELRELLITYFLLVYTWEFRRFFPKTPDHS